MWRFAIIALCFFSSIAFTQQSNVHLIANAKATGPKLSWAGGIGAFDCVGTWNGATVTLQYVASDGVTMQSVGAYTTLTANGNGVFYLYASLIQAVVTGAGASTSITCTAGIVPSPQTN